MKLGLHIPYARCEATYAALAVARVAYQLGFQIEIYPQGSGTKLDNFFDKFCVRRARTASSWLADGVTHVLHTKPAKLNYIQAAREKNIFSILLVQWEELAEGHTESLGAYNVLLCPTKECEKTLRQALSLDNTMYLPFDSGLPFTQSHHTIDEKKVAVVWVVDNLQVPKIDIDSVKAVSTMVNRISNFWLTVVYPGGHSEYSRAFRRMSDESDGRIEVVRPASWEKQQLIVGHHDLLLLPSRVESTNITAINSLSMGTPVIAFDHPATGDVVNDGVNGTLVPAELSFNWLGVPYCITDYKLMEKHLAAVLSDVDNIEKMTKRTLRHMDQRREQFCSRLYHNVFGEPTEDDEVGE